MNAWNPKVRKSGDVRGVTARGALRFSIGYTAASIIVETSYDGGANWIALTAASSLGTTSKIALYKQDGLCGPLLRVTTADASDWTLLQED